jgi:hypothetical protein
MKAIVILLAVLSGVPAFADDNVSICFSEADAVRLLRIVEKELPDCRAGAEVADQMVWAQAARVAELQAERDQCIEAAKQAAQASEDAVDAARGSWWERFKSSATKVGMGVLIGIGVAVLL